MLKKEYIVKIYIARKDIMTSKNDEIKIIMKNNQCTGNLAVMAKLTRMTLTKFEKPSR